MKEVPVSEVPSNAKKDYKVSEHKPKDFNKEAMDGDEVKEGLSFSTVKNIRLCSGVDTPHRTVFYIERGHLS